MPIAPNPMLKTAIKLNNALFPKELTIKAYKIGAPHHAYILMFDLKGLPDPLYKALYLHLSASEKNRAKTLSYKARKRQYILGRALTRLALSWYSSKLCKDQSAQHPSHWQITTSKLGKPMLKQSNHPSLYFNISHTPNSLVIALSNQTEVGIDIETIGPQSLSPLPTHLLTNNECLRLDSLKNQDQIQEFALIWTTKEAVSKCLGTGMHIDFSRIEVSQCENEQSMVNFKDPKTADVNLQQVAHIKPDRKHLITIATAQKGS